MQTAICDDAPTVTGWTRGGQPRSCTGDLVGSTINDYRVLESVGRGGSSTVYRATHVVSGRACALKVLDAAVALVPEAKRAFRREAELIGRIRHPAVIDLYESGTLADGRPYLAMEWLEGLTLEEHLRTFGRMGAGDAISLIEALCAAVAAAHAVGVVHCDIKAANVILLRDGSWTRPRLIDFGIARLSGERASEWGTGAIAGTPANMAPEQVLGQPLGRGCDIYALGVLLYQVLTGRLPFTADSASELAAKQVHSAPPPTGIAPASLEAVVARCLAKRPGDRFMSVHELMRALREASSGPGAAAAGVRACDGLALYCELQLDESEAALLDDAEQTLERLRRRAVHAGLQVIDGATSLLVVETVPDDSDAARRLAEIFLRLAASVTATRVVLKLHRAAAVVRRSGRGVRIVGGELVHVAEWPEEGVAVGIHASDAFLEVSR